MNRRLPPLAASAPAVDPLMRAMLDASPLGVFEYELRGDDLVMVRANAAAASIIGVDCKALIGRTLEQAFPDLEPTDLPAAYRAVARGGPPLTRADFAYRGGGVEGIYEMFVFQTGTATIAVMFRDVAPERRAAQAMAESEAKFAAVFRGSPEAITVVRLDDHTMVDVNPAFERIAGVPRAEAIGRRALDFGLWADPAQRSALMQRLQNADYVVDFEFTNQARGRPPQPAVLSSYRVKIGGVPHIVTVTREVSAERRAEAERAANAERIRRIFELIPEPVAVIEIATGRTLDVNRAWSATFGFSRDEVIGRTSLEFGLWPESAVARRAELLAQLASGTELAGVAIQLRHKGGQPVDVELTGTLLDMPGGKVGIWTGRDVTQQRRAEAERAANAGRVRRIFDLMPEPVAVIENATGRYLDVNRAWTTIFGYERGEVIGRTSLDFGLWPQPISPRRAELIGALVRDGELSGVAVQYLRKDRKLIDVELSAAVIEMAEGKVGIWVGRDVTEQKRLQAALAASEARLRRVFELFPEPVGIIDHPTGRFIDVNRAWERVYGWPREQVRGRTTLDLGMWPDVALRASLLARLAADNELFGVEVQYRRSDGQLIDAELSAAVVETPDGPIGIWVGRDITERKRLREVKRASEERLATMFRIAPAAMALTHRDGARFIDVNEAWLALFGYQRSEVIGPDAGDVKLYLDLSQRTELVLAIERLGRVDRREIMLRRRDGGLVHVLLSGQRFDLPDQPAVLWSGLDITDRKRAEQTLRESEQRLRAVVRSAPVVLTVIDRAGVIRISEGQGLAALGLQPGELIGKSVHELYADQPKLLAAVRRALGGATSRLTVETGGAVTDVQFAPLADSFGSIDGVIAVAVNVTERVAAERALAESEARFVTVFNESPVAMAVTDPVDERCESANDAFLKLFGYAREEIVGFTSAEKRLFAEPAERQQLLDLARAVGSLQSMPRTMQGKDGIRRLCEVTGRAISIGGRTRLLWAVLDVTAQREAEQTLRESEARFAAIFNESPVALAVVDPVTDIGENVNNAMARLFGFAREEMVGVNSADLGLFADPAERERLLRTAREQGGLDSYPAVFRCKDGRHRVCELTARAISIGGRPRLLWAALDVTARREAEHQLRNTVTQLQTVIMAAPVVLFALGRDGRFTLLEGRALQDIGLSPAQLLGRDVDEAFRDAPEVLAALRPAREGRTHNARIRLAGRSFALYCQPLNPGGASVQGVIGVLVDLTDQLRAEEALQRLNEQLERRVEERTSELARAGEELIRVEKLAALGSLVAGVAHELNTPIGNSVLVASSLADATTDLQAAAAAGLRRSALAEYLSQATASAQLLQRNLQRAGNLIASFKQVAVDQTSMQRREFDLAEVLHENVTALMPSIRSLQHRVEIDAPAGIRMNSFPGPLGQVLANLINNAVQHAFEGRGPGTVHVAAEGFGASEVRIEVRDDGRGIAPEHLARIFDPFFTTRLGRGGSGLGLNIVHNLVTGVLGGSIDVRSQPDAGTTFTLLLPRTAPPLGPPATPGAAAGNSLLH